MAEKIRADLLVTGLKKVDNVYECRLVAIFSKGADLITEEDVDFIVNGEVVGRSTTDENGKAVWSLTGIDPTMTNIAYAQLSGTAIRTKPRQINIPQEKENKIREVEVWPTWDEFGCNRLFIFVYYQNGQSAPDIKLMVFFKGDVVLADEEQARQVREKGYLEAKTNEHGFVMVEIPVVKGGKCKVELRDLNIESQGIDLYGPIRGRGKPPGERPDIENVPPITRPIKRLKAILKILKYGSRGGKL